MHLTPQDVRNIASSSRIRLSEEEVGEMSRDLNVIVESLKPITQYNLDGVEPTFHPIAGLCNVMRDDCEEPGFTQEEALASAPYSQEGQFKIPPILAEGGGDR